METYDDIRAALADAVTNHRRTIELLNAHARTFATDLAQRLRTDESNIQLGQGTGDTFEVATSFPAKEGRNEILVSVQITIPVGADEVFTSVKPVKFRADRHGLHIEVPPLGAHLCGELGGAINNGEWQHVFSDFIALLQMEVNGLIDKMRL